MIHRVHALYLSKLMLFITLMSHVRLPTQHYLTKHFWIEENNAYGLYILNFVKFWSSKVVRDIFQMTFTIKLAFSILECLVFCLFFINNGCFSISTLKHLMPLGEEPVALFHYKHCRQVTFVLACTL